MSKPLDRYPHIMGWDRRFQVFVSSTYLDLISEREQVLRVLLELGCFPAGMELFPAEDSTAWDHIRQEIDESDIYVLIVSGRYGSLDADGMSFTEREYRYAVQQGKPVYAFLHSNVSSLPADRIELDPLRREKLDHFKEEVRSAHLIQQWTNGDELGRRVATTLNKALSGRTGGWVRDVPQAVIPGAPQVAITECDEVTRLSPTGFTLHFQGILRAVGAGTEVFVRKSGGDAGSEFVELHCTTPGMTTLKPSVEDSGWSSTFIHLGRWLAPGEEVPISWVETYRQSGEWEALNNYSVFVRYSIGRLRKRIEYPESMRPQRAAARTLLGDLTFGAVVNSTPLDTTPGFVSMEVSSPVIGHTYGVLLEWDSVTLARINQERTRELGSVT